MGDPKKLKKKYSTPMHPWIASAIVSERKILKEYGLKNKQDILVASSFLKKYKNISKRLSAHKTSQNEKEKQQVLTKLQNLGLLPAGSELHQILALELPDILERRLQSIVFRHGLARSMKQARQFIVHRHISISNKEITGPSYLVTLEEAAAVTFKERSTLASEDHPERIEVGKVETIEKAAERTIQESQQKKVEENNETIAE